MNFLPQKTVFDTATLTFTHTVTPLHRKNSDRIKIWIKYVG